MPAGPNLRKFFVYDPALAYKLWRVLSAQPFDIIHAHHLEGLLVSMPGRLRHRIPIIYDAHTMLSQELPSYWPSVSRRAVEAVGAWLDGVLPRGADHIVAVTQDIRDCLIGEHRMRPESISVVMNGVETASFRVEPPTPTDGLVRLIYTGTLAPYQDIDLLLEAFARAHRERPDLRLCFSVSSPFDPYEALASRLGIRDVIEVVPDGLSELPGRLAACSIAVLPRTRCPGIPQKLLNYMAAAKAIVSSAGSAKILENERTGLVVPNGDTQAFAQALLRLAGNPVLARELGRSARELVERGHSWQSAAEQLERIYDQLTPVATSSIG
jgi:glycosyltransferase involved in cell wall biosynthesis